MYVYEMDAISMRVRRMLWSMKHHPADACRGVTTECILLCLRGSEMGVINTSEYVCLTDGVYVHMRIHPAR